MGFKVASITNGLYGKAIGGNICLKPNVCRETIYGFIHGCNYRMNSRVSTVVSTNLLSPN